MIDIITFAAARLYTDATKEELEKKIEEGSFLKWKGTKELIVDLPLSGENGDVWHVNEDGGEYGWNGEKWEELGKGIDLSEFYTKQEIDSLLDLKEDKPLVFENITVATTDFVEDSTYVNYPYKVVITCQGVTSSMTANVYLDGITANLGTVSQYVEEGTNTITIYCLSNDTALFIKKIEVK